MMAINSVTIKKAFASSVKITTAGHSLAGAVGVPESSVAALG